jgi:hypothetical protein
LNASNNGKKIKPNEEYISSELPSIVEVSESPNIESSVVQGTTGEIGKTVAGKDQTVQEPVKPKVSLFNFFNKTDKSAVQENPSTLQYRTKEEIRRNPFL